MLNTTELKIPDDGLVVIQHEDNWSGLARMTWLDKGVQQHAEIPANLFVHLIPAIAFETFRLDVVNFVAKWPGKPLPPRVPDEPPVTVAPGAPPAPDVPPADPPKKENGDPAQEGDGK